MGLFTIKYVNFIMKESIFCYRHRCHLMIDVTNLNAGRDYSEIRSFPGTGPIKPKRASSQTTSHRFSSLKSDFPSRIKVTSTVTTKTVKPPPASPKREQDRQGQAQDLAAFKMDIAAMMRNMIKSSLTEF